MTERATDEDLYRDWCRGSDPGALQALMDRHWRPCFGLAVAVVRDPAGADDVVQEAFIRLVEARSAGKRLDPVAGWLRAVTLNEARKWLRGRRRRARREEAVASRRRSPEAHADPAARVREYADALPERLREPLVLHFALGLTHVEVARTLGCPAGTASSRIRDGLESLRRQLAASGLALTTAAIASALAAPVAEASEALAPAPRAEALLARARARPPARALPGAKLTAVAGAGVAVAVAIVLALPLLRGPREVATRRPLEVATAPGTTEGRADERAPGGSTERASAAGGAPAARADAGGSEKPEGPAAPAGGAPEPAGRTADDAFPALRGRVVAAEDGRPIAGADVILCLYQRDESGYESRVAEARSDAAGAFVAEVRPYPYEEPASYFKRVAAMEGAVVLISCPGREALIRDLPRATVAPGGGEDVTFELALGGLTVRGRVVERGTGRPVPGVRLVVVQDFTDRMLGTPVLRVTAGPDGRFERGGLAAVGTWVQVDEEVEQDVARAQVLVDLRRNRSPGEVVLEVERPARIILRVRDREGRPVPEFHVGYQRHDRASGETSGYVGRIGRDGEISLEGLVPAPGPDAGYRIEVGQVSLGDWRATPPPWTVLPDVQVRAGETLELAVAVEPAAPGGPPQPAAPEAAPPASRPAPAAERPSGRRRVLGLVVDEAGRPVAGARVSTRGLRVPPGGLREIFSLPEAERRERFLGLEFELPALETGPGGDFALDVPDERAVVRVEAAKEGLVTARQRLYFAALGADLPAPSWPVPPDVQTVRGDEAALPLVLRLLPPADVVLRLRAPRTPPGGIHEHSVVAAFVPDASFAHPVFAQQDPGAISLGEGGAVTVTFTFRSLARDSRGRLVWWLRGFAPAVLDGVEVGGPPVDAEIALDEGVTVRGRIVASDGRTPLQAGLQVVGRWEGCGEEEVDASGAFRIAGLPRDRLELSFDKRGYVPKRVTVDASASREVDIGEVVLELGREGWDAEDLEQYGWLWE